MPQDVGYKLVTIKGEQIALPGDMSDEEVAAYKQQQESGAPESAPQPEPSMWDKFKQLMGESADITPIAASEEQAQGQVGTALDFLPGVGGAVGATVGGPGGAALGAAGGESVRQLGRRTIGLPAATGLTQELAGLDPDSPLAAALGIGVEASGAGATEKLMRLAAGAVPGLRESALRTYAKILSPKNNERALADTIERIRPIQDELPSAGLITGRSKIEKAAEREITKPGGTMSKIEKAYNKPDVKANYDRPVKDIRAKAAEYERTPEWTYVDDQTGELVIVPPNVSSTERPFVKALEERVNDLRSVETSKGMVNKDVSLADLFQQRGIESRAATRAKADAFKPGLRKQPLSPKAEAHATARGAISAEMKRLTGGASGEGAIADALHNAWKTVESGSQLKDPGFLARWVTGRVIPGPGGTAAGAVAANPAFWRSVGSKNMRRLASLIEAGDETGAEQLFRTAVDVYSQPEGQP